MSQRGLAEHLLEQRRQIAARREAVEEGRVARRGLAEIEAMVAGVVHEVALDSPGLAEHLAPLLPRIDRERPAGEVDALVIE